MQLDRSDIFDVDILMNGQYVSVTNCFKIFLAIKVVEYSWGSVKIISKPLKRNLTNLNYYLETNCLVTFYTNIGLL